MNQVLIVHGGSSFNSYQSYLQDLKESQIKYERLLPHKKWKPWIAEQMPGTDVLLPTFPNGANASYEEWRIYFEKIMPFLDYKHLQLVGHSLGAMFLTKYLSEQPFPTKIAKLVLIASGYDDESNEELGSFGITSASRLADSAEQIHLFHSQDDPIVPYTELAKFERDLPHASVHRFAHRGHFLDETFPELLELLQQK